MRLRLRLRLRCSLPAGVTSALASLRILRMCNTSLTGAVPAALTALGSLQFFISPQQCGMGCDAGYACVANVASPRAVVCTLRFVVV